MIIYNLFPLLAGRFSQWEVHLEHAAAMGFDWIFVNPIEYPGFSGSLYSIKDYSRINPLFLDESSGKNEDEQVWGMIEMAASHGLNVMIDLVVNHTAIDSVLVERHPQWFARDKKGAIIHPSCDENGKKVVWGDLALLDHEGTSGEAIYEHFRKLVLRLISQGFKGFRCDAAYQLPQEFWSRLIASTKQSHPSVVFAAETLGCSPEETLNTAKAGFDYIFNSSKWWDFKSPWLMEQYNQFREVTSSISFPESHDTLRLCEELNGNVQGLKLQYLFSALFSSGVMMPLGYEYGFRKRPHVVKTRPSDWEDTDIDITGFVLETNSIKKSLPMLNTECKTSIIELAGSPHIMAMLKESEDGQTKLLCLLNRDFNNPQPVLIEDLYALMGADDIRDITPEHRMVEVERRLNIELGPAGVWVLVGSAQKA